MRVTSWPSLKRSLAKWLPICPAPAITMRMGMSGRKGACENTKRGAAEGARPRMKAAVRGCGRKRVLHGGDSASLSSARGAFVSILGERWAARCVPFGSRRVVFFRSPVGGRRSARSLCQTVGAAGAASAARKARAKLSPSIAQSLRCSPTLPCSMKRSGRPKRSTGT